MTASITLRDAIPADHAQIREILSASALDAGGLDDPAMSFLLAIVDGSVVGTIGLEHHGTAGLLRSAAVAAECRGRGIGARLTAALVERARALGLREIFLLTTTAAPFFARLGFDTVERSAVHPDLLRSPQFQGGCPASAVCMRRSLART